DNCNASRFIQAIIKMRPVFTSWAIAGTSPSPFQLTVSNQLLIILLGKTVPGLGAQCFYQISAQMLQIYCAHHCTGDAAIGIGKIKCVLYWVLLYCAVCRLASLVANGWRIM